LELPGRNSPELVFFMDRLDLSCFHFRPSYAKYWDHGSREGLFSAIRAACSNRDENVSPVKIPFKVKQPWRKVRNPAE
jgi:hypothetical protein